MPKTIVFSDFIQFPKEQSETKVKAFEGIVFGPCTLGRTLGHPSGPLGPMNKPKSSRFPYKPNLGKSRRSTFPIARYSKLVMEAGSMSA